MGPFELTIMQRKMVERAKKLILDEVKADYLLEALVIKLKFYV